MDHRFVTVPGCQVQRGVFLSVAAEQVGVGVQEHLDHFQPPVESSQVQGCLELVVAHGGVGELLQQHLHHLGVAVLGRAVQRRLVVVVLQGTSGTGSGLGQARSSIQIEMQKQDKKMQWESRDPCLNQPEQCFTIPWVFSIPSQAH